MPKTENEVVHNHRGFPHSLWTRLNKFCHDNNISIKQAVNGIVEEFLDSDDDVRLEVTQGPTSRSASVIKFTRS